jgi:hypothetical protein
MKTACLIADQASMSHPTHDVPKRRWKCQGMMKLRWAEPRVDHEDTDLETFAKLLVKVVKWI